MKRIVFTNQKGGAGKTTITMLVALALGKAGKKVGVIDLDIQETATKWVSQINDPNLSLYEDGKDYDVVFYDTPPSLESTLKEALRNADLVIIVSSPSPADLWSTKDTVSFINQEFPSLPLKLLFNKTEKGRKLSEDLKSMANLVGVESLSHNVPYYSAYQHAVLIGWDALKTKDKEAILNLAIEIAVN